VPERAVRRRQDPDKTYRNRKWMQIRIKAGKTPKEIADMAGASTVTIYNWIFILGLMKSTIGLEISEKARRTYGKLEWWIREGVRKKRSTGELVLLLERKGISVEGQTLRKWRKRFCMAGKLPHYPWKDPVVRGPTVGEKLKQHTIEAAAEKLELRINFGEWVKQSKPRLRVLREIDPRYQRIIRAWYINRPLPESGAMLARGLKCTRANVSLLRKCGIMIFHTRCPIPSRFWPVTIYAEGTKKLVQVPKNERARRAISRSP